MLDTVIMAIADQWGLLKGRTGRGAPQLDISMLPSNRIRIAMPKRDDRSAAMKIQTPGPRSPAGKVGVSFGWV